jgi:outer membrane receptor protein involved in Fe transport
VRLDYESYMKKAWVDPRLSVLWTPVDWLTIKGGAAMYHQPPDYRVGQLSPIFGNPGLQPEGALHFTAGAETRFSDAISLDVNVYYKQLTQQVRQVLTSGLGSDVNIPGAETRFSSEGYGRAYGAELLLRHKLTKNFFGWIAYSLSRFERDGYGGEQWSPGPLDQPHNLIVVASYKLPYDFVVGGRFRFASGPLVTPVVASLYDVDGNYYYPLPGKAVERAAARLPPARRAHRQALRLRQLGARALPRHPERDEQAEPGRALLQLQLHAEVVRVRDPDPPLARNSR